MSTNQISWTRLPFKYRTLKEFETGLQHLISRAFYETFPSAGLEIREEQIYTSYRIAKAMTAGEVFMAEAGAGTGKTYAYLVPAVCHARRLGRPVVISCATGVLQSQLAAPGGDADTLSRLLDLGIDARLADDPSNYVCESKVEDLAYTAPRKKSSTRLRKWAESSKRGARAEIPDIPDDLWALAAWDQSLPCDTCRRRGYCRMNRAREHYRQATDLVVCSHDLFFIDLWSRAERQTSGLLPLLPYYSGVIFDEGHRVPSAARDSAAQSVSRGTIERTLRQLEAALGDQKDYLPYLTRAIKITGNAVVPFWAALSGASRASSTERFHVDRSALLSPAESVAKAIAGLEDAVAMSEDLVSLETKERFSTLQWRLDEISMGLSMLRHDKGNTALYSTLPGSEDAALYAVPSRIDQSMQKELYQQRVPVVFTSATLAGGGSFDYLKRIVGAPGAGHSLAGVPFDFASQALLYLPEPSPVTPESDYQLALKIADVLRESRGRALVLVNTSAQLARLRSEIERLRMPWTLLWEGDALRADLLRRFREDTPSVLLGTGFWEGVDIPGESLSCVIVPWLPFPPDDPLYLAREQDALADGLDAFQAIAVPEMALKLKQGCGRLIRTASDRGVFALLDTSYRGSAYESQVEHAFPEDAEQTGDLGRIAAFLGVHAGVD